MAAKIEEMSKEELVAALSELQSLAGRPEGEADQLALLHDLEVNQIQLEMQNRRLRETQHDLERSKQRYSDLYDFAPIVYVTLDRAGRIEDANLTAATLLATERSQIIGKLLVSFVAVSQRPTFRAHLHRCVLEDAPAQAELLLTPRDRTPVAVEIASVPIHDEDGRVTGCRTTLTDISALKRTERRLSFLAAASKLLGAAFEGGPVLGTALCEVLRSLVPLQADVAFVDLVDGAELRRFDSGPAAAGPDDAGLPAPPLGPASPQRRVVESGKPIMIPYAAPGALGGADGLEHEELLRQIGARALLYVPLISRDQRLGVLTLASVDEGRRYSVGDLTFATDLASRIAAAVDNDALYRSTAVAVRAREDVLSFVAHDLRGLLNGIQLTVQLMLGRAPGKERRRGWKQLERVQRVIEQMNNMIDDIQEVTDLDAGQIALDLADLTVDDLLIQARDTFGPAAAEKGVELQARLSSEPVLIRGDATRVMRVLGNLVGNAIKFTPEEGVVTLSTSVANRHVLFSVRDTGIGVAAEQVPKLFERYWQADESAHKGRGLGLFIAKRLVEVQGGTIWVESQAGAGTTMFFTLPRSIPAEHGAESPPTNQRRTVLDI
jgi:PAS domain S-box-containing protein